MVKGSVRGAMGMIGGIGMFRLMTGVALAWTMAGCASLGELLPESQAPVSLQNTPVGGPEAPAPPPAVLVAAAEPTSDVAPLVAQQAVPAQLGKKPTDAPATEPARAEEPADEFVDPFAREGEAGGEPAEISDPWEPFNQAMFTFNRKLDEYLMKPVAEYYDKVVWDPLEFGISNAFHNIRFVPRLLNNLFQGKVEGAAIEAGRFVINSSFGIGGFFDFAGEVFKLKTPDEDFGQTLGVYDVKPGAYLVLPFLGPFTLRDAGGYVVDLFLDPFNILVFPFVTVNSWPQAVTNSDTITFSQMGIRAGYMVNERSINIDKTFEGFEKVTVDLYGSIRSAYHERRAKMIRE